MTKNNIKKVNSDYQVHQKLIEFQKEILHGLAEGIDSSSIAAEARKVIKAVYGHPIPSGAELGISVNDICNLRCAHCYYASTQDKTLEQEKRLLSLDEWIQLMDTAVDEGFRKFSIIGKEPLLSADKTKIICDTVENRKKEFPDIKYEMITNGTLIEQNIDWISSLDFNFLSISFDGCEDQHDLVRGAGSYQKSLQGLQLLSQAGVKNITVSHTVMPHNVSSLEKMICDLHEAGAEYFSICFCFSTPNNNNDCVIHSNDIYNDTLKQLSNIPTGAEVSVNICAYEIPELIGHLIHTQQLEQQQFAVTQDLAPALIIPIQNSPRVAVQFNILPLMYYSGFRLDCTGYVMDFCTDLQDPEKRKGFGNVRDTSIRELWNYSRETLWPEHTEEFYRTLTDAVGEWH